MVSVIARVSVTAGCPISSQAAPTTETNGCAASVPLASSVRGWVGSMTMVCADHSGVAIWNGAMRSECLVKRLDGDMCSIPSGRIHHHTASQGTSVVAVGLGPKGTVPAGLAQHSSPLGVGQANAGVHSGRVAAASRAVSTMSLATQNISASPMARVSAFMISISAASLDCMRSRRRLPGVPGSGGDRPSEVNRSAVWSRALHHCRRISGTLVAAQGTPWRRLTASARRATSALLRAVPAAGFHRGAPAAGGAVRGAGERFGERGGGVVR